MARSGINKALVKQARDALLARGEHPSIDAVRIALGHTGSKSTIHRYLKELESEDTPRLGAQDALSDPIATLVGQLAEQLETEAQAHIQAAEERHQAELKKRDADLEDLRQRQAQTEAERAALHDALEDTKAALARELSIKEGLLEQLQNLRLTQAETLKDVDALNQRIDLQAGHLSSLEEKHRHAREALEHYREATRVQREQDQRRHEQEVQQLQAELRQASQTLILRQDEITRLHRDNERLSSESRTWEQQAQEHQHQSVELRERLGEHQSRLGRLEATLERERAQQARLETIQERLRQQRDQARDALQNSQRAEQRLRESLAVREQIETRFQEHLERLMQRDQPREEKEE